MIGLRVIKIVLFTDGFIPRGFRGDWHLFHEFKGSQAYMGRKVNHSSQLMLDFGDADFPPVIGALASAEATTQASSGGDSAFVNQTIDQTAGEAFEILVAPNVKEQFENICRAVSSSNDVRAEAIFNGKLKPGKTRWKASTIVGKGNALRRYFGFLSVAETERGAVLPEDATLALAVFPRLTVRYPLWLMNSRPVSDAKSLKTDFYMLDEFRSWLAAGGLLTQQPELAKTLRPVAGVISDDDISRVQQDWEGACRAAYDEYSKLLAARPDSGDNTSLTPIMPILKLKDPSIVVRCMIEALSEERRSVTRGSLGWARLLRDEVYLHIQLRFAFRSSTILSLTPHMISVGEDGIKWIDVDRMLIKNGDTKTFKLGDAWINYLRPIEDGFGSYEAIDLYLNEGREILLQGRPDHGYLMVSATGIQMLSLQDFTEKLTTRYLITNPKAPPVVRGMLPLYNHAFRHIVACSTLRSEGLKMAAWVLMDSEPTVENFYGFLNEEDMNARYFGMVMARHGAGVPAG